MSRKCVRKLAIHQKKIAMSSPTPPLIKEREDTADRILTKAVKAGRRTYFFDVRSTRGGDHFLTITESRKVDGQGGGTRYDRRQLFLYKEDFEKFTSGLAEVLDFIRMRNGSAPAVQPSEADDLAAAMRKSDQLFDAIFEPEEDCALSPEQSVGEPAGV